MAQLEYVTSFRDLIVYRKTRELQKKIFDITLKFPKEELYSLTDQVRRSSRSIGAQIAEAWAKRRYEKHFISKLTDADGEQLETQHWIETALDCQYISKGDATILLQKYAEVGRLLGGMMSKADKFCNTSLHKVHELQAEYFVDTTFSDSEHSQTGY